MHVEMNKRKSSINSIYQICGPKQPVHYKVWLSCSSVSTRWRSKMFMISRSDWWSLVWSGTEYYRYCGWKCLRACVRSFAV